MLLVVQSVSAQVVGTPYIIPADNRPILDQIGTTPSFAFSTRKLRAAYTGPALKLRRPSDASEVTVAFDANGVVSDNSIVTLTYAGSSGAALGTTATLLAYRGANTLYVTTWYDQGGNSYDGVQTTAANQPVFSVASAGGSNQYASLNFVGTSRHHVVVNQTLTTLLGNALRATIGLIAKPGTPSATNNSFGYFDPANSNNRWSCHLNWSDGNCYTDFGSSSDLYRNFVNSSRQGVYKQYTMLRGNNYKTVKISGSFIQNAVAQNQTTPLITGGNFGVGVTTGGLTTQNGFVGNIPEFIVFKEPLTASQISILEYNQISFWGAY